MSERPQSQKTISREHTQVQKKAPNHDSDTYLVVAASKRAHLDSYHQNGDSCSTSGAIHWLKMWDTVIGSNYYYNPRTGEAS